MPLSEEGRPPPVSLSRQSSLSIDVRRRQYPAIGDGTHGRGGGGVFSHRDGGGAARTPSAATTPRLHAPILPTSSNSVQMPRSDGEGFAPAIEVFWNKPVRGVVDPRTAAYVIDGLQQLDLALELIPQDPTAIPPQVLEGLAPEHQATIKRYEKESATTKFVAYAFVDHLLSTSVGALKEGTVEGPPGFLKKVSDFADGWRWASSRQTAPFYSNLATMAAKDAEVISDASEKLVSKSSSVAHVIRAFIASQAILFFIVQAAPLLAAVALLLLDMLDIKIAAPLLGFTIVADGIFKYCCNYIKSIAVDSQEASDAFTLKMATIVSEATPLTSSSFGGVIRGLQAKNVKRVDSTKKMGSMSFWGDGVDENPLVIKPTAYEDGGEGPVPEGGDGVELANHVYSDLSALYNQPAFLLDPEDALQRRRSLDALLVEADDDEGCITIRIKGFAKVQVEMNVLNTHLMIVVTDLNGKVIFWNDGAATLCGFSSHDAEGKHISSFLFGEKSVALYDKMSQAASTGVSLSSKPLTVANSTFGQVTVKATVTSAQDSSRNVVGFVLMASQQEGDSNMNQAAFHQHYLGELVGEVKELCAEKIDMDGGLGRCGRLMDRMGWSYLRDLASATKDWSPSLVQSLLNEVLKDRHRQVDVRISPHLPDQIVCDGKVLSEAIAMTLSLMSGKLRLSIGHQGTSEVLNELIITAGPANEMSDSDLAAVADLAIEVGGDVSLGPHKDCVLVFPFLVQGGVGTFKDFALAANMAIPKAVQAKTTTPMTILLLEKNAVYRHNISTIAWASGHSLRLVDTVQKGMRALSEGASQFGCAIIDIDMRDIGTLISALRKEKVYLIETTENDKAIQRSKGAPKERVVLAKPLSKADLEEQLEMASGDVIEKKKVEEEIVKRREILGKVRNSPWTRGKKLGHGAFADVYEATSTLTGGKMAVKMIKFDARSGEDKIKLLINEIEILAQLAHPNIVHYFYCERGENTVNLFMELATEGSLQDLLARRQGVLTEEHVAQITKQLLNAMNYLHDQDIIHRDIKPGNILLSGGKVKLTDFGTATQYMASDTQGTIYYMAPEVLDGVEYNVECDIWSVGCVVCECLGIKRPPRPDSLLGYGVPDSFPPHCSDAVKEFIFLCLQYDPAERAVAGSLLLHDFIVGASSMNGGDMGIGNPNQDGAMSTWTVGEGSGKSDKGADNNNIAKAATDSDRDALSVNSGDDESTPSW